MKITKILSFLNLPTQNSTLLYIAYLTTMTVVKTEGGLYFKELNDIN